ncbi:MAG: hypothetical protein F7B95_01740 [Desulfurococcales archaeon]|nr:hypothetical protein [Desulfurococcales archaeon]
MEDARPGNSTRFYELYYRFCRDWRLYNSIAEIASSMGLSRPTFYSLIKRARDAGYNLVLVPNTIAIKYNLVRIRLPKLIASHLHISRAGSSLIELNTGDLFTWFYAPTTLTEKGIIDLMIEDEHLTASYEIHGVICKGPGDTATLVPPPEFRGQARAEELALIAYLANRYVFPRELGREIGIPWQYLTSLYNSIKSKGLAVAIALTLNPASSTGRSASAVFVELTTNRMPLPKELAARTLDYPIVARDIKRRLYTTWFTTTPEKLASLREAEVEGLLTFEIIDVSVFRERPSPPFTGLPELKPEIIPLILTARGRASRRAYTSVYGEYSPNPELSR